MVMPRAWVLNKPRSSFENGFEAGIAGVPQVTLHFLRGNVSQAAAGITSLPHLILYAKESWLLGPVVSSLGPILEVVRPTRKVIRKLFTGRYTPIRHRSRIITIP